MRNRYTYRLFEGGRPHRGRPVGRAAAPGPSRPRPAAPPGDPPPHPLGPGAGRAGRPRGPCLVWGALCRRARRAAAVAAAPGPRILDRASGLHRPRFPGPAALQRDACGRRGLPPAGHLRPRRGRAAAGGGVFPRRRQPHRLHPGDVRRQAGRPGRLRLCVGGIPAGSAGLQLSARPPERPRQHRQLRPAGRGQSL